MSARPAAAAARKVIPIHAAKPGTDHGFASKPGRDPKPGKVGNPGPSQEASLYEVQRKIYPRAVTGWFARWRWTLVWATQIVFYGLPWLLWNDRQAVLFDLAGRKFYIFGVVLWPQDVIYLAVLLVISALALFLFTAIAGRVWCGYACPQTVYTEIFLWIERRIEGDRLARMKLDAAPPSARKIGLKGAKHAAWGLLALWTGFTFVGYFTPIQDLLIATQSFAFGPWEGFWIAFYGFATYGNAGWMREQVCKHMCPYARFQGVMFDPDTLVVTYDGARGDPRGSRGRKADPKAQGLGDCIDCQLCVQVCPAGIDIRDGLQYECIGCTACIDACNQVMDKMGYARGLIRYSTENALKHGWSAAQMVRRVVRPRVLVYGGILLAIVVATAVTLTGRVPVKVDVIRDRTSLAREAEGGRIENVYRLNLMNTEERARSLTVTAAGAPAIGPLEVIAERESIELQPLATRTVTVRVRASPHDKRGSQPIEFVVESRDANARPFTLREKSRFLFP